MAETHALVILAEGTKYSLLGDISGGIVRFDNVAVKLIRDSLGVAERIPCPPLDAPKVAGYNATIRRDIPPDVVIKFRYHICPVSLITVYVAFEAGRAKWYVRELRDEQGKPTGNYHAEGGDYRPPSILSR
jgi:hypothetical protein